MATPPRSDGGTLLVAALLLLGLSFAGAWIFFYVSGRGAPMMLLRWYAAAAGALVLIALVASLFPRRKS